MTANMKPVAKPTPQLDITPLIGVGGTNVSPASRQVRARRPTPRFELWLRNALAA